tara:strand:+ start:165 stop:710 length:546 start_codon:yes stop_codon:yes gene_type:complete
MAGIGKYKKGAKFTLKSGNNPSFFEMGSSPLRKEGYGRKAQNLLKAVPNKEAYDKLSDTDKKGFDKAAKKANLPMKKNKKDSTLKLRDVKIGDEWVGTGPEARAKGIKAEEKNKMQRYKQKKEFEEWSKKNPKASEADWAKAQKRIVSENPTIDVEYTGRDKDVMDYEKRQARRKNIKMKK